MTARTSTTSVNFENTFTLSNLDEVLPSGTYELETDEELLEGLSFTAYRRTRTVIRLPSPTGDPNLTRALTIDPDDLDAALVRDRQKTASDASNASVANEHEEISLSTSSPDD